MRLKENRSIGEGDEAIHDAARAGAVSRLFAEHNSTLVRVLRLRLRSDQEAREVAQEAYVRLLQLNELGAVSFLRAYLFRIANNLATDRLRRIAVRQSIHADPVFAGEDEAEPSPDRRLIAHQQLRVVEAALEELPDPVRRAFLLHRLEGHSMREIGDTLSVTERTAYNYVVRAMVHCRARLDEGGGR
jgi:RNA polymerase sigma factor (sigma-70 family)